jgi:hypothetical protein
VQRLREENVGAITFGLFEPAVVPDGGVKIGVARRVAATARVGLPDAARAVDEHFIESAPVGLISVFVAQMPLAENTRGVAGGLQHLRQRHRFEAQPLALVDGVRDAGAEFVAARHQRGAGGRASRADVEIGETDALPGERIQVRGFENRIPGKTQIAVTLVIGHHQRDVRWLWGIRCEADVTDESERADY